MPDKMRPILIAGPTAAGKSALALALAEAAKGVVINADALQVYACWRVLSARPDARETARAPHMLYGHVACDISYSTGDWLREVGHCLQQAQQRRQQPIIIGGTGLYFTALTQGLAEIPEVPDDIRNEGNGLRRTGQTGVMLDYLTLHDPETLKNLDVNNPVRVQRAWEVHRSSGKGMAAWHRATPPPLVPESAATCIVLDAERDWLADRIDRRFHAMLDSGAIEEARAVLENGWNPHLPAMRAIGARELIAHLQGDMALECVAERGTAQSRQYAKRQRTWFRNRLKNWRRLPAADGVQNLRLILK